MPECRSLPTWEEGMMTKPTRTLTLVPWGELAIANSGLWGPD